MASGDEWEHEMFVLIRWKSRKFAVPLSQLEGVQVDEEVGQAFEDWDYWVDQGTVVVRRVGAGLGLILLANSDVG